MRPEPARAALVLTAAILLATLSSGFAAESTPLQEVEGRLMCYCGCSDLTVRVCTCGTADAIRRDIAARLADGETPEQVVAAFVAKHGPQIRSAPGKSGFELVAWVTPFAALLLAGTLLVFVVRRWGGGRRPAPLPAEGPRPEAPPPTSAQSRALERVRREMKEER